MKQSPPTINENEDTEQDKMTISHELKLRIISAIILAPVILGVIYIGDVYYNIFIVAISILASFEWANITFKSTSRKWHIGGVIYILIPMVALAALRSMEDGLNLTLLTLLMVWATDIGAYFAGRTIGGPKILPKISPKKTWAGLFGGMTGSALTGLAFALYTDSESTLLLPILGGAIAIVAQAGDFFESWVKRKFDVKDSGDIIPGHGGILDRIDGIMTAAPVMLLAAILYGNLL